MSYWQADTDGVALAELTSGQLLDRIAVEMPDHEALVYSCYPEPEPEPELGPAADVRWTYSDYRGGADAVACALIALGLGNFCRTMGIW